MFDNNGICWLRDTLYQQKLRGEEEERGDL